MYTRLEICDLNYYFLFFMAFTSHRFVFFFYKYQFMCVESYTHLALITCLTTPTAWY